MIHARHDYMRFQDPLGKIDVDEPVFLMRAQDSEFVKILQFAVECYRAVQATEVVRLLERHVERAGEWRSRNWRRIKVADVPAPGDLPRTDVTLDVARLSPAALLPTQAHADDAGWDLYTPSGCVLAPHTPAVVATGVALGVPPGYYVQLRERSSLARRGVVVLRVVDMVTGGVVDSGYTGEVGVVLLNITDAPLAFASGDKVAQFVVLPVPRTRLREVESLAPTARGAGGFGSTDAGQGGGS